MDRARCKVTITTDIRRGRCPQLPKGSEAPFFLGNGAVVWEYGIGRVALERTDEDICCFYVVLRVRRCSLQRNGCIFIPHQGKMHIGRSSKRSTRRCTPFLPTVQKVAQ